MVAAIDDEQTMQFMRLFNEPVGRAHLQEPRRGGGRWCISSTWPVFPASATWWRR
jgi:hypothetical protein